MVVGDIDRGEYITPKIGEQNLFGKIEKKVILL
jgi:hypothetical protein